ncbi:MAG: 23S rRNA (guanosine(2251)-2'-O)-methyltransferase RlmB [Planctomycetaceae bacterium]|nr:23S rRNA (guanosine(2251)-2'-O)-methyltransferase RlmB [Planctomycetaceae bacterium]
MGSLGRSKRKHNLLGNHQKCWIWGRHAVVETVNAARWPILELRVSESLDETEQLAMSSSAESQGIPFKVEPSHSLTKLCGTSEHQGYAAKMTEFPYSGISEVFAANGGSQRLAILDGIQDPYNFGSMIRSACVLGLDGMIVADTNQCAVTSFVARTSAGAVNHLPIAQVDDWSDFTRRAKDASFRIYGTSPTDGEPIGSGTFAEKSAVVIGNEARGIGDELLQHCDQLLSIPQKGQLDSLNASISAAILFYEMSRS